jgi:hypothetical protein
MHLVLPKHKKASVLVKVTEALSTPDRIRTYDLRIRSALLYPAELRAHMALNVQ